MSVPISIPTLTKKKGIGPLGIWSYPILTQVAVTLYQRTIPPIPPDVEELLNSLRFHDVQANADLTNKFVYMYGEENSWQTWYIGYGSPGKVANDIVVDLGYNTETGEVSVGIAKLCSNAVEIYQNENLIATLEQYTAVGTPFTGYVGIQLRPPKS